MNWPGITTRSRELTKKRGRFQFPNLVCDYNSDQKDAIKSFVFDAVFGEDEKQETIYEQSAFILVDQVIMGYNGTIFAYG